MTDELVDIYGDLTKAVFEVKRLLDLKGVSDSGREYNVYSIGCCHIGQEKDLDNALREMFALAERY